MAKGKRASRKIMKVDDVQRTLELRSASSSVGTMTIQVPDMLMRSNRRQYQQCRAYDVQIQIGELDDSVEKKFEIYTLSNAWWVKKSIEFAKAVWLNSTKEERALLGSRRGKWNDFIIGGMDTGAASNFSNLYQYNPNYSTGDDMVAEEVTSDESLYEAQSKTSGTEGDQDLGAETEYGFTLATSDLTGSRRDYNIFDQYLLTRNHVSPTDTRDTPYEDLLDVDQSAMDNLKQDGDNAPFDLNAFPSPWVLADTIGVDQGISAASKYISRRITAPLGIVLVKFKNSAGAEVNYTGNEKILLHAMKGNYKGVHAPAYRATKLLMESSGVSKFKQ